MAPCLKVLENYHMERIIIERNKIPETLRTTRSLNSKMQEDYFNRVLCNRNSTTYYWAGYDNDKYIFYGGTENIDWINSTGEISLLIFEEYRNKGYGKKAVELILDHAFNTLNINSVWGECYYSSSAVNFWKKIIKKYNAYSHDLPLRKYYNGKYWPSLYFVFERKNFKT